MTAIKKRKRKITECTDEHNITGHAKKDGEMLYAYRAAGSDALGVYTFIILLNRCHAEVDTARKKVFASVFIFFILKERVLKCQARNI